MNKSDFDFVTGDDLDDIDLSLEVMPKRASDKQKILAGVDICWLAEAVRVQRRCFSGYINYGDESVDITQPANLEFTKKLSSYQRYLVIPSLYCAGVAVKTEPPQFQRFDANPSLSDLITYYQESDFKAKSPTDTLLKKSFIMDAMEDLKLCTKSVLSSTFSHPTSTAQEVSGNEAYTPPQSGDVAYDYVEYSRLYEINNGSSWRYPSGTWDAIKVPKKYFDSISACVTGYFQCYREKGYTGYFCLSLGELTKGSQYFTLPMSGSRFKSILADVATRFGTSLTPYQEEYGRFVDAKINFSYLILVGNVSNHVKWW